jgi:hypothetical protein
MSWQAATSYRLLPRENSDLSGSGPAFLAFGRCIVRCRLTAPSMARLFRDHPFTGPGQNTVGGFGEFFLQAPRVITQSGRSEYLWCLAVGSFQPGQVSLPFRVAASRPGSRK